jgi:hypothetical protein
MRYPAAGPRSRSSVDADLYACGGGVYDGRIAIDLMNDQNILIRPFALSLSMGIPKMC